jgi:hypothetical protein
VDVEFVKSSFCALSSCVEVGYRKSSFSGIDCIEVGWTKSSASGANCVEVSAAEADTVLVRDTKDRSKPPHEFTREEWIAFVKGVKAGEFDL